MSKNNSVLKQEPSYTHLTFYEKLILWLFPISLVVIEIAPNSLYYVLSHMEVYVVFLTATLLMLFGKKLKDKNKTGIMVIFLISCLVFFLFVTFNQSAPPFFAKVYYVIFAVSFLVLRLCYRQWVYDKFVKIFAILFFLGLVEYLLVLIGIHFFWGEYVKGDVLFLQGIFVSIPSYYTWGSMRFMAFCDEPGNVGTLSFFILATMDRLKYKKEYMVFLIAGILSFSLAFYILYSLWVVTEVKNPQKVLRILIPLVAALFLLYIPFKQYFDDRIIDRIESGSSFDDIDNRSSEEVKKRFAKFIDSSDIFMGVGERDYYKWKKEIGGNSVGLKEQLFMYGIVGFIFLFFSYSILFLQYNGSNKFTQKQLVFYWLSFYQRAYWFFPPVVVIMFSQKRNI